MHAFLHLNVVLCGSFPLLLCLRLFYFKAAMLELQSSKHLRRERTFMARQCPNGIYGPPTTPQRIVVVVGTVPRLRLS